MGMAPQHGPENTPGSPATKVTYIGHSTMLVEMNGVRLLTDPVLGAQVTFLRRRSPAVASVLLQHSDIVLLSHAHGDHFDLPSLRRLDRATRIIAPAGVGARVARLGFTHVDEAVVGAEMQVGALTVRVTPALHGKARYFFQQDIPCVGYVIQGAHTVYFAGDTDIFPAMAELAGTLDLALLPVWGWGPTLGVGHLDPQRAAQALAMLAPRYAIPIHWGTLVPWGFDLFRPRFLHEPPHAFVRHAAEFAPAVDVRVLAPGEHFVVPAHQNFATNC